MSSTLEPSLRRAENPSHLARRILPLLAMRTTLQGGRLGQWRWVVERTFARLNQFRRVQLSSLRG
jgi:transposase